MAEKERMIIDLCFSSDDEKEKEKDTGPIDLCSPDALRRTRAPNRALLAPSRRAGRPEPSRKPPPRSRRRSPPERKRSPSNARRRPEASGAAGQARARRWRGRRR